jgi:peptidoglycan hydrolase-like protein with peptidoglycan-binding domain
LQRQIGARFAPGLLVLTALLAAVLLLPSPAAAAPGQSATQVREVQRLLVRSGHTPGPLDGRFGPLTKAALTGFERAHGLRTTSVVGSGTLRVLRSAARAHWPAGWKAGPVSRGSGYRLPHGSRRVRQLQRRLDRAGYHAGPIDGLFGPLTERAVKRFQLRHGLAVDGVAGRHTLRALGLRPAPRHTRQAPPAAPRPSTGRPAPAHVPQRTQRHKAHDPVVLVIAGIVLLGLLTVLVSYLRTAARLRRRRRELEARLLLEHATAAGHSANGHSTLASAGKEMDA